jgi:hypothetical protein
MRLDVIAALPRVMSVAITRRDRVDGDSLFREQTRITVREPDQSRVARGMCGLMTPPVSAAIDVAGQQRVRTADQTRRKTSARQKRTSKRVR